MLWDASQWNDPPQRTDAKSYKSHSSPVWVSNFWTVFKAWKQSASQISDNNASMYQNISSEEFFKHSKHYQDIISLRSDKT